MEFVLFDLEDVLSDYVNKQDVFVIIRSVGERSEYLCQDLISEQVPEENIAIVRNKTPFSAALTESYRIGIEMDFKWTLCVDADVLLRPGAIAKLLYFAEQQDEKVCGLQGYILDKFFGGPRCAGNHLYRTSYLEKILKIVPTKGEPIRPESVILETMVEEGYPWKIVPYLIGLHDFEQYYRDIYRKCFVHSHKHQAFIELFLSHWRDKASTDIDYQVAVKGFANGIEHYGQVLIDTEQKIYQEGFSRLGLEEKEKLSVGLSLRDIEAIISNWVEPEIYQIKYPTKMGLSGSEERLLPTRDWFIKRSQQLGLVKIIPYAIGWLFTRIGKAILRLTNSQ